MEKGKPNKKETFDSFIKYSSLGFEMMAIIALFTFIGYKTDQWMQNERNIATLIFVVLSVVIAILYGTRSLLNKK